MGGNTWLKESGIGGDGYFARAIRQRHNLKSLEELEEQSGVAEYIKRWKALVRMFVAQNYIGEPSSSKIV